MDTINSDISLPRSVAPQPAGCSFVHFRKELANINSSFNLKTIIRWHLTKTPSIYAQIGRRLQRERSNGKDHEFGIGMAGICHLCKGHGGFFINQTGPSSPKRWTRRRDCKHKNIFLGLYGWSPLALPDRPIHLWNGKKLYWQSNFFLCWVYLSSLGVWEAFCTSSSSFFFLSVHISPPRIQS